MAMTFGTSVFVNNILALRAFYTFLFNYQLHEKPSFLEKLAIPYIKRWIESKAVNTMNELLNDYDAKSASVSLNDVSGDFFAVLYLVQNPQLINETKTGKDLFQLLSQMALEFERVRKPHLSGTKYENG